MRAVLDTTNIVSAIRSPSGAAAAVLGFAIERRFTFLMDYRISCEYRDVALRPRHMQSSPLSKARIENLLLALENVAEPIDIVWRHRPLSNDPNDDLVLDLAINGNAKIIVTDNLRHIRIPAQRFGIEAVTPLKFLSTITAGGS